MKIPCDLIANSFEAYDQMDLSEEAMLLMSEHLANCPSCQEKYREYQEVAQIMEKQRMGELQSVAKKFQADKRKSTSRGIILAIAVCFAVVLLTFMVLGLRIEKG